MGLLEMVGNEHSLEDCNMQSSIKEVTFYHIFDILLRDLPRKARVYEYFHELAFDPSANSTEYRF